MYAECFRVCYFGNVWDLFGIHVVDCITDQALVHHAVWVTSVSASSSVDVANVLSNDSMVLVMSLERQWETAERVSIWCSRLSHPG